jgi:hypothetical protein
VSRKATQWARPRLFGQFLECVFSEVSIAPALLLLLYVKILISLTGY